MADSVKIKINGMASLLRKFKRQPDALEVELRDVMLESATAVMEDVKRNIDAPKSGRMDFRKGVRYRRSAPGEAPARATGVLYRQIEVKKSNRKDRPQSRIVAPGIYRLLENGTRTISPRPSFQSALARHADRIEAEAGRRARAVFKRTSK